MIYHNENGYLVLSTPYSTHGHIDLAGDVHISHWPVRFSRYTTAARLRCVAHYAVEGIAG